jgi:uncharacterized SAM-binding protein YcdF (DUF218 family)
VVGAADVQAAASRLDDVLRPVLAASLVGLAAVQAVAVAFVHPPSPALPATADAVVVLAGDHGDRVALAADLVADGRAPLLVVLHPEDGPQKSARPDCGATEPYEVLCLDPPLVSTRGDARAIRELAATRRWQRVVVVTSRFHVLRAGIVVRRCVGAEVTTVGSKPPFGARLWAHVIVHELGGLAQAASWREC